MKKVILFGFSAVVLAACAGGQILPTSMNASLLQSLDSDRSSYEATGIGEDYEMAVADAEKVAIAKSLQDLVQSAEEKSQFSFVEKSLYTNHKRFVEGAKLKDRKREADDTIRVKMDVIVNKKTLESELVSLGVIKERKEIIQDLKNPSVAVLVSEKDQKAEWAEFAVNHASSYLTGRKFQVLDLSQVDKLNQMDQLMNQVAGGPSDSLALIALKIGSDIYVQVEGTLEGGKVGSSGTVKASASVKVFETTTARQLGAATGFSKNYANESGATNKALAEAISDAVDRVLTNVMDYWKDDVTKGSQFLVTVRGNFAGDRGQRARRSVHGALQKAVAEMQQTTATDQSLMYRVWYKGANTDLLFGLQDAVEAQLPGSSLRSVVENRKMLILQLDQK